MSNNIEKAYEIAKKEIENSSVPGYGIVAGGHYAQVWTRDSMFASLGFCKVKMFTPVKETLEILLKNQKNGQIPLRVGHNWIELALLMIGVPLLKKKTPIYFEDKMHNTPMDPNSLCVIGFYNYIKESKDYDFLRKNISQLESAIKWYERQSLDTDGLIKEEPFANWADTVKKEGKVLYTNICYCYSLHCFSILSEMLGEKEKSIHYETLFNNVKTSLNKLFWNGKYYTDWVDEKHNYTSKHFYSDGNLLAIVWGIADNKMSLCIQKKVEEIGISSVVPSFTNAEKIHIRYSGSFFSKMAGLSNYHNTSCWTWLGAVDTVAKMSAGMIGAAKENLERIGGVVAREGTFKELYDKNGNVYKTWFYKTPSNFTWSAGMYIWAYHEIFKLKQ